MAFNNLKWVRSAAYGYEGSQVPVDFKYGGITDTKAATLATDYFLPVYEQLTEGSMIQFTASDATLVLAMVTAVSDTTVATAEITETLPPGSVDTADIADGAVTTPKIADLAVTTGKIALLAVTNAQMAAGAALANLATASVTAAKLATDVGYKVLSHSAAATAATSTAFTVTGTLATDKALATMTAGFSQPIVGCVCTADTVTVHYAAAALVTDTVDISVFRGAA